LRILLRALPWCPQEHIEIYIYKETSKVGEQLPAAPLFQIKTWSTALHGLEASLTNQGQKSMFKFEFSGSQEDRVKGAIASDKLIFIF
jgi:hypothetical protein